MNINRYIIIYIYYMWTMLHLSGFEPCAGGGDGEVLSDSSGSSRGCSPHGVRDEEGPAAAQLGRGVPPGKRWRFHHQTSKFLPEKRCRL